MYALLSGWVFFLGPPRANHPPAAHASGPVGRSSQQSCEPKAGAALGRWTAARTSPPEVNADVMRRKLRVIPLTSRQPNAPSFNQKLVSYCGSWDPLSLKLANLDCVATGHGNCIPKEACLGPASREYTSGLVGAYLAKSESIQ